MKLAIRSVAFALLALLAANPTSAAKQPATSFRIHFDVSRGNIDTGYYTGSFNATGAIQASGSATTSDWPWASGTRLESKKGNLYLGIWPTGEGFLVCTFTIRGDGAYSGISGGGTATGKLQTRKNSETVRWQLEGTLSPG